MHILISTYSINAHTHASVVFFICWLFTGVKNVVDIGDLYCSPKMKFRRLATLKSVSTSTICYKISINFIGELVAVSFLSGIKSALAVFYIDRS